MAERRRWPWPALALIAALTLTPLAPAAADGDIDGLPPGDGREAVRDTCAACHSLMLVRQQRLSRRVWSETLDWMVAEQGMAPPSPAEREAILNYLSGALGQDVPR